MDVNGTHAMTYVNEQEVTFDEGEIRQMFCYVNGSYPKPEVKVSVKVEKIMLTRIQLGCNGLSNKLKLMN